MFRKVTDILLALTFSSQIVKHFCRCATPDFQFALRNTIFIPQPLTTFLAFDEAQRSFRYRVYNNPALNLPAVFQIQSNSLSHLFQIHFDSFSSKTLDLLRYPFRSFFLTKPLCVSLSFYTPYMPYPSI